MKNLIIDLFGLYEPVTYIKDEIEIIPNGLAGVDFPWLAGFASFMLVLYFVLKTFCMVAYTIANRKG